MKDKGVEEHIEMLYSLKLVSCTNDDPQGVVGSGIYNSKWKW